MYSLDINFLKDPQRKPEEAIASTKAKKQKQPIGDMVPIIAGLLIMVLLPALAGLGLFLINGKKTEVNAEIAQLEEQIRQAQAQNTQLQTLQGEFTLIKAQTDAFVNIFNQIQPISAIFQDLLDQVPQGIQIDSVIQAEDQITITGISTSYYEANDFLLTLKKSGFFVTEETYLTSVSLTENPTTVENIPDNLIVEFPQVVNYTVQTKIQSRPASEILDELNRKGAGGLVSRIKILQEKGVITQ
jgi:type IV pilus assembly protein PilN